MAAIAFLVGILIVGPFVCFLLSYLPMKVGRYCGTCESYDNQDWSGVGVCENPSSIHCGVVNTDNCRHWERKS